ncbi:MAG: tRNA delta(2)-isopentenylpyrophosphate transferase transferase [Pseudomonadota bacterium]
MAPDQAVITIVGPTASGKSSLAMAIARSAKKLGKTVEIISMDSALVYRGMDIGTAKPSKSEMEEVRHHGIDIAEPEDPYSAAKFAHDAKQWLKEIRARNNIPLIVGGTMLYWRALAHGLSNMPAASPEIRAEIESRAAKLGWSAIHDELAQVDPATAARLEKNDAQRVQRALEIYLQSGKPMSEWLQEQPKDSGRGDRAASDGSDNSDSPLHLRLISIEPSDRSVLHERIAKRFEVMIAEGFLDEMNVLRQNPRLHPDLPSMRAVGYRQAWDHLDGNITFQEFQDQAIAATRQLAKRQLTWLRGMQTKEVIDSLDESQMKRCEQEVLAHYQVI